MLYERLVLDQEYVNCLMIDLWHGLGFCYLCICHIDIYRVSALLSMLIRVCKY
jgi:hypothetical protein